MQPHVRRSVAYIAARAISGSDSTAIYDYSAAKHFSFSGDVGADNVNVYDYEQRVYIGGPLPSLYHYGTRRHIDLRVDGEGFSGYDYDSSQHFSGTVRGNTVSLYDYEHSEYFSYTV
jgi:hypothetical protein